MGRNWFVLFKKTNILPFEAKSYLCCSVAIDYNANLFYVFFVQFSIDRNVMNLDDYLTTQKQEDFRFQLKDSADIKQALKGLETQLVTEERSIKK